MDISNFEGINVSKQINSSERNSWQDQLSVVRDSNNNDIVLSQGRFAVRKLMSLSVSGELLKLKLSIILN